MRKYFREWLRSFSTSSLLYDSSFITFWSYNSTGLGLKVVPRLRECCRQSQAKVVSKSRNKIQQTWGLPFSQALNCISDCKEDSVKGSKHRIHYSPCTCLAICICGNRATYCSIGALDTILSHYSRCALRLPFSPTLARSLLTSQSISEKVGEKGKRPKRSAIRKKYACYQFLQYFLTQLPQLHEIS